MRLAIITALAAALAATPAFAVEADPMSGVGVSVETWPDGGIMITQGDCAKKSGKITRHANGKWYCDLPLPPKLTGVRTPTLGPAGVAATPLCPATRPGCPGYKPPSN